jgi:hypothetical protein
MLMSLYPGTEITFLPVWLENLWRIFVWVAILFLLVRITINSNKKIQISRLVVYDRAALTILLLSGGILDGERWGQPVTLEGLPALTIALYLTWRAIVLEDRWRWLHKNRDKK